jgi:hypothetical protein
MFFDVYSKSQATALAGIKYSDWQTIKLRTSRSDSSFVCSPGTEAQPASLTLFAQSVVQFSLALLLQQVV